MYEVTERVLAEQPTAVVRRRMEVTQLEGWIGAAVDEVLRAVAAAGSTVAGPPFTRCLPVEGTAACVDAEAGVPVGRPFPAGPDDPDGQSGRVQPSRLPGGSAAVTVREGPDQALTPACEVLDAWIARRHGVPDGPPWENYVTGPGAAPQEARTEVVQPYTS